MTSTDVADRLLPGKLYTPQALPPLSTAANTILDSVRAVAPDKFEIQEISRGMPSGSRLHITDAGGPKVSLEDGGKLGVVSRLADS